MSSRENKMLVMGFGSSILTDDGIALKIVEQLSKDLASSLFDFKTENLISLETLETISGYKKIIIIDATSNTEEQIGQVNKYLLKDFKSSLHLFNIHDLSIHHLSELAGYLSCKISTDIIVITVNVKEKEEFSSSLSSDLNDKYVEIYSKINTMIEEVCLGKNCVCEAD